MQVLVIDNYDSFTYNLVHLLQELGADVTVRRNDKTTLEEVGNYSKIMLSPGPGIPNEAGMLKEIIRTFGPTKSLFGVCLGHQAIGEIYGGKLFNSNEVWHGVATPVTIVCEQEKLFSDLPKQFNTGRYHSWLVEQNLPDCLVPTAVDESGNIMALRHKEFDVRGVQFHPESVLTEHGREIIKNWLLN
ncbi:aminodeoxychorismate/anthranilate synthase component II [Pontibacter sp. BT310]|uniref:Aminodeoxychorismate/anthranilate synthase component II n=1 Tax=Pontibacter populi TaxID=890055 RepID=A0ABS6X9S4_9BACT|nr:MULTISPECIES: aminodeoxychorismate/anthranilate synthase component II [Pontibacter]MBJ6117902.1 aminodeoxychorismate/anthranilate synthase component II [Pontibacter sp. BT310]MBR0570329.1 aminodeoxychorismate/anthranilate synthase component II [Microvirga sp. STS03]MBW3364755.1 aminodeoxychorismate/anthranilate synthase component II [Pontibacter populi]